MAQHLQTAAADRLPRIAATRPLGSRPPHRTASPMSYPATSHQRVINQRDAEGWAFVIDAIGETRQYMTAALRRLTSLLTGLPAQARLVHRTGADFDRYGPEIRRVRYRHVRGRPS